MALLTTQKELDTLREAIQTLTAGSASVTIDGITYQAHNLDAMQRREAELYRRLTISNQRKRTVADLS